ncbi:hydroxyacylglutathione hydrolase [Coxiella endosymbiont of Amblyomma nuttalli]|uniref:hydroxyacylglutathione hydrolase n=1 Tax=Coxiella endosymbiont of Amblyomma nuttalli TaxID=2749996 RepID=UPI001BA5392E|nr:hydroxyacylglutathione hydrolase [Coxiella endosymbiont of Amblyomma nuttalli]QTS84044.1 Hydroxyacylglutathione hydrolase [Coxiella endosymbiont of Amblyomma nuttalli]
MLHNIFAIPALNDNYIWTIVHSKNRRAVIVDPGEAEPVLHFLEQKNFILTAILITHHHWDHTNGIRRIVEKYSVPIYGPSKDTIPFCNYSVRDRDTVELSEIELTFKVLEIPGHTLDHIVYWGNQWVYTGDTLFMAGCGRIFEGFPEQFYHSLMKLASLDPQTKVYCGHEYTDQNLQFAATVEPDNFKLKKRIIETRQKLSRNQPTPPSTIQLELETNPFLRCHEKSVQKRVQAYCGYPLTDIIAIFTALRCWKNEFSLRQLKRL